MHSCVLRRTHPELPGIGSKAHVVLHVADTEEEWHTLVTETFGLELKADLSDDECKVLWTRVSSDHAAWLLTPAGKDFATA